MMLLAYHLTQYLRTYVWYKADNIPWQMSSALFCLTRMIQKLPNKMGFYVLSCDMTFLFMFQF